MLHHFLTPVLFIALVTCGDCFQQPVLHKLSLLRLQTSSLNNIQEVESTRSVIATARLFATTSLGINNPGSLAEDFVCSGPNFDDIGKKKYLADFTKETTTLQRAMQDFDIRPYSFRVDESQPDFNVVWFKIRPKGKLTGPFAYKGETYLPNQKSLEFPIQQMSVTIRSGQISRVTAGYTIDRFSGNTGGLAGPLGVLYALGESPSKFAFLPPAVVIRHFFSRSVRIKQRKTVNVSPFPVAVMISLAKRVIETSLGAEEPELLSSDFQFSGPLVGPLQKDAFVNALKSFDLRTPFPNLKAETYNYEIDSFDPERVWAISESSGTQTGPLVLGGKIVQEASGIKYVSCPEAVSVSFNEQGLCYKATGGYILDKKKGNTKSLGGVYGIFEAIGGKAALPFWESRSLGDLPRLIKESVLSSFSPDESPTKKTTSTTKRPTVIPSNLPVTEAEVQVATVEPTVQTPASIKAVSTPIKAKKTAAVSSPNIAVAPTPVAIKNVIAPSERDLKAKEGTAKEPKMDSKKQDFGKIENTVIAATSKTPAIKGFFSFSQPKQPSKVFTASETTTKDDLKPSTFSNPFAKKKTPSLVAGANSVAVKEIKIEKEKKGAKLSQQTTPPDKVMSEPSKKKSKFGNIFSMEYSKGDTGRLSTGTKKLPPEINEKLKK